MLTAFMLLGLKVGEAVRDGQQLVLSFDEAKAEAAKSEEAKKEGDKKDGEKKEGEHGEKKDGEKKEGEHGEHSEKKEGDPKVNPPSTDAEEAAPEEPPKHEYSQVEVDLLQSLAKRRQDLDDWAKQVQLKENMLIATEQRINTKIDGLQKVKKQVEDLLAQYNAQEDTKIRSLVKIYENMKPKDAARIFEELDMPVLLMVVDRMSERKVSPVLAAMTATKAKDVTVQLAEQRKLQKNKVSQPDPNAAPAPADSAAAPATPAAADGTNAANPAPAAAGGEAPAAAAPAATGEAAPAAKPPAAER